MIVKSSRTLVSSSNQPRYRAAVYNVCGMADGWWRAGHSRILGTSYFASKIFPINNIFQNNFPVPVTRSCMQSYSGKHRAQRRSLYWQNLKTILTMTMVNGGKIEDIFQKLVNPSKKIKITFKKKESNQERQWANSIEDKPQTLHQVFLCVSVNCICENWYLEK